MSHYTNPELREAKAAFNFARNEGAAVGDAVQHALAAVAPAIVARAKAEAWDEAAESVTDWMWNNPSPSGIPHDPPRNPYEVTA